jgi:hypothetical protein
MPLDLASIDLSASLSKPEAEARLLRAQQHLLHLRLVNGGLIGDRIGPPLLILFEGWDASGKGGAIRRLVSPLDPRHYRVDSFATPSPNDQRHHFLWRFFGSIPGNGGMVVLDRTWYGRVLVERVEQLIDEVSWERAYGEINDFERSMAAEGVIFVKFFLHISEQEQLLRFEGRRDNPLKRWKLTDEDWGNRALRPKYEVAVDQMLQRTDTSHAPWIIVPAESKHYARVFVVEKTIEALERGMRRVGLEPPQSEGLDYDSIEKA